MCVLHVCVIAAHLYILVLLFVPSLNITNVAENWDYIIFSQAWPKTTCRVWNNKNNTEACAYSLVHNAWTIHGIWPTLTGSQGPEFCNQTWIYDPEEVKSLESELERSWTNILRDSPKDSFWTHEWNKHGTCAADLEIFNTQKKYFSIALQWHAKYAMNTLLSESNIVPSETKIYTTEEIYNAVKNKLGVKPEIMCASTEGKQYLREIRLCFSRSVEIIDCKNKEFFASFSDNLGIISNCDVSGIFYV